MAKEEETSAKEGKLKALQAAMAKIEKDFGKGSIMKMGDEKIEQGDYLLLRASAKQVLEGGGGAF